MRTTHWLVNAWQMYWATRTHLFFSFSERDRTTLHCLLDWCAWIRWLLDWRVPTFFKSDGCIDAFTFLNGLLKVAPSEVRQPSEKHVHYLPRYPLPAKLRIFTWYWLHLISPYHLLHISPFVTMIRWQQSHADPDFRNWLGENADTKM